MQQVVYETIQKIKDNATLLEEQWKANMHAYEERCNERTHVLDARERDLNCRKRKLDGRENALRDGEVALAEARAALECDIDEWRNGIPATQLADDTDFNSTGLEQEHTDEKHVQAFTPPPRRVRQRTSRGIKVQFSESLKGMTHNTCVHICARL